MAGLFANAQTAEIASGTSKKTLVQLIAAANHRVLVHEISISFDGTSNVAQPVLVEIARQSTAGTMSALTPAKVDLDSGETLQTTATHTASAEPTETDVLRAENVHPQTGYTWVAPYGRPIIVNGGDRLGVAVTAAETVNAVVCIGFEE
jgi:hypothetical protein